MKKSFLASLLSFAIIFLFSVSLVYAYVGGGGGGPIGGGGGESSACGGAPGTLPNPFKGGCSLFGLLQVIIENILMPIGAVLAVIGFIYSGFLYVTAQGNETKIKTAHKALLYTAIGTALLLGAWTFANVIKNTVNSLVQP
jgi:hypothetical protein